MTELALPASGWPMNLADFCAAFEPPDFLVDGLLQRGCLYALTRATGSGKTAAALSIAAAIASGTPLGERSVKRGRVLFLDGEHASDVAPRLAAHRHRANAGSAPDRSFDENVCIVGARFALTAHFDQLLRQVEMLGRFDLIVVDRASAFFDRTGSRPGWPTLAGIRMLRRLTRLPGNPTVLVTDHMHLNRHALGGLFDGHLRCHTSKKTGLVRLASPTSGRGRVEPLFFKLVLIDDGPVCDSKGRPVPTVIAVAVEAAGVE